jgi:hypothetical protein
VKVRGHVVYFVYKVLFWNWFQTGMASLVMLGESIGFVHSQVLPRPMVFERERINSDQGDNP